MNITDPIADMLTRIRNANSSKHKTVDIPSSNIKLGIAIISTSQGLKTDKQARQLGVGGEVLAYIW